MERGDNAARRPGGVVRVARDAAGGCFLYGPFWRLREGGYCLSIHCRAGEPRVRTAVVFGAEIIAEMRLQIAWRDFDAAELAAGVAEIDFTVPPELSHDAGDSAIFEFRVFHSGNADLNIEAIVLRHLGVSAVPVPARRWRLSGRPDPRRALPADDNGFVALQRWARAGQFLLGVRPMGGLPAARYRLRFRCRDGPPRNPQQPVLGIEIFNSYLAYEAHFTADELNGGTPTIDFAVPPELGLEGGAAAPVALKFIYLRNGPLAVAGIELELLDDEDRSPGTRPGGGEPGGKFPKREIHRDALKDLIIVGNCHAAIVYEGFRAVPALARYFRARYYNVNLQRHLFDAARRDLERCELLVVQDLGDWEDCPLRGWASDRIHTVMFPCVWFASPWPFDGFNGPTDREAIAREHPNFTFTYFDGLLARLRREIPDRQQRFQAYRSLDCPGVPNYRRLHQFEIRRMLALDAKHSCTIGERILGRFQSRQVFYTINHPDREIFEMILANIMRSLGVKGAIPHLEALDQLQTLQIPVHPLVAEALEMRWATEERKYRFRQEELTWEEYVRRYIDHYG